MKLRTSMNVLRLEIEDQSALESDIDNKRPIYLNMCVDGGSSINLMTEAFVLH